jgi:acyl-ACP thioesterase
VQQDEFTSSPERGRVVTIARHVGLADVRPDATVRLDALARFLQDAADRDAATADVDGGAWVLRRLTMRLARTPRFRADLSLATWCSGIGPRWAERRTTVRFGDVGCVEAVGLWVHVDPSTGAPVPLPRGFHERWGSTANGRRVRASLRHGPPPAGTRAHEWPLRVADLDVLAHVNNAAYWVPVEEELARRDRSRVTRAEMEFRGGLDGTERVEVLIADTDAGFASWCCVDGDVRASALVACAPWPA